MKKVLLLLCFLLTFTAAFKMDFERPNNQRNDHLPQRKVMREEFHWVLDFPRILLEEILVLVLSPLFLLSSILLNNQEIYIVTLYRFLYLKIVRLSGWDA